MPPTQKPTPPNHLRFDPWNSASTGHQIAESAHGSAWRQMRQDKLARQFLSADGDCRADLEGTIGTGIKMGGERKGEWSWTLEKGDPRQRDIRGMFGVAKASGSSGSGALGKGDLEVCEGRKEEMKEEGKSQDKDQERSQGQDQQPHPQSQPQPQLQSAAQEPDHPQLFKGTTVYINSASHPLLSDHKLKHLLTLHGATIALHLSRRVSHVIVGKPNAGAGRGGAGGGLAGGKLQKEIARGGWKGTRFVFVEWVLESIKAGKRVSEGRFAMPVAQKGQRSVLAFQ